ncbi:TCR/Tet family MFS transporter [Asticcacaulis sp.]|uniref:TCR/Tet family MFS transporter n=1 Tax=Asticcacaulis sp. TaxID=1872648 RepID=UPI00261216B9|nr:TCR/Tet family MFS transporter [Asticcacaulis sp.]
MGGVKAHLKPGVMFIFITVCLDMMALGLAIPVLPRLIETFVGSVTAASWWSGVFNSLWGFTQFVCSPILGSLSDRFGRRPIILMSNLGLALDYLIMALSGNLIWLLIGRLLNGVTSSSITTAYAYISDISEPDERAQMYGYIGAAFGVGFVMGPALGGMLGHIDLRLPFWVAGGLSLLNALYGALVLPESLDKDHRKPFSLKSANPIGSILFLWQAKSVMRLALISMVSNFAHHVIPATFVLYASYRLGWGGREVGLAMAYYAVWAVIVQGGLTGMVVKRIGEKATLVIGLLCGVVGFMSYGYHTDWRVFLITIPIMSCWGMTNAALQSLMTTRVGTSDQGLLQGAVNSLMSLSGIIAPFVFGYILSVMTRPGVDKVWSGAAFFSAAVVLLVAFLMALGVRDRSKDEPVPEVSKPVHHDHEPLF